MAMDIETVYFYYNDTTNSFEDEEGAYEESDNAEIVSEIMPYAEMVHYKEVGGTYCQVVDGIQYEIIFPIQEDNRTLYYNANENVMEEEHGIVVFNIFSIISPATLQLFKIQQKTMEVRGVSGGIVKLIWPEIEGE